MAPETPSCSGPYSSFSLWDLIYTQGSTQVMSMGFRASLTSFRSWLCHSSVNGPVVWSPDQWLHQLHLLPLSSFHSSCDNWLSVLWRSRAPSQLWPFVYAACFQIPQVQTVLPVQFVYWKSNRHLKLADPWKEKDSDRDCRSHTPTAFLKR